MAWYQNPYSMQMPLNYNANMYAPQQSFAPQPAAMPMQSNVIPVDGEVGAKAFSAPAGSTGPIALWDTNDNVIYLRTFNAAGMPNPLRKLRYTEEEPMQNLNAGQSGNSQPDMSQYVTRDDLENLRQEIRQMREQSRPMMSGNVAQNAQNNQNGSRNGGQGRQ